MAQNRINIYRITFLLNLRLFLKESFNLNPSNIDVFSDAFTHSSCKMNRNVNDYERLELLGDSIINFCITLFIHDMNLSVKDSCNLRKEVISGKSLSYLSKKLGFHEFVIFGKGCCATESILEDVYESFVAAVFLNFGFERTKQFIFDTLWKEFLNDKLPIFLDYKTSLQEHIQKISKEKIVYESTKIQEEGLFGFEVSVFLGGILKGVGRGKSLKEAEQDAAKHALENLT